MNEIKDLWHTVYKATAPTGHSYIGVSKHGLSVRRRQHVKLAKSGSKLPIHNAIRKYGNKLTWTTLAVVDSRDRAMELEKELIASYGTQKSGYNLTSGGDGVVGRVLSKEEKRRLSLAHRGQIVSQSARAAMSKNRRGSKNPNHSGRIFTPFGIFKSYNEAEKVLNITKSTLSGRCHSKSETWKEWYSERNPK